MVNPIDKLVVDIALLSLVTESPEKPSDHRQSHISGEGRAISLKDERSICHQLSFICAYSQDPGHIVATCIEEGESNNQALMIRIAANSGKHGNLLAALNGMASILQNEAKKGGCLPSTRTTHTLLTT
jgi:hypothetical protein